MNLYRFKGLETALVVAEDETEAMGHLVKFIGDEVKEDGGEFTLVEDSHEQISYVNEYGQKVFKWACECIEEGPGVFASSVY